MRLWSIDPKYLDSKGLVALWRETLLAQKVLQGKTKGYINHPQLDRFKACKDPLAMIGAYLLGVWDESVKRGYNFDKKKIIRPPKEPVKMKLTVTSGQIDFEIEHLLRKIEVRVPDSVGKIKRLKKIVAHKIFSIKQGAREDWERV